MGPVLRQQREGRRVEEFFSAGASPTAPEALVVGAGVVGASAAFHLAERGVDTLLVDRAGPAAGSTARSGALVRAHYPTALESDLAWESLTGYFEPWGERVGGGCGFARTGFAYLVAEENADALRHNVALGRSVGVETQVVSPEELAAIDPNLRTSGIALAALEPRGGYADPAATAVGFVRAARRLGARLERRLVTGLLERGGEIRGVRTESGPIEAGSVVLAAGAWSVPIAASVGLALPVRPARVGVALFERPFSVPTHLTLIDTIEGFYTRPAAESATLVGSRTSLRWIESPDEAMPEPTADFVEDVSRRLGRRLPPLAGARYRSGRSGVLDMTPDGRPILGPAGPGGLYLAVGWSGTGFKKAPAVGAELARWVAEGAPERGELASYDLARFERGSYIRGEYEYAAAGPH